jgi:hypothetical protein
MTDPVAGRALARAAGAPGSARAVAQTNSAPTARGASAPAKRLDFDSLEVPAVGDAAGHTTGDTMRNTLSINPATVGILVRLFRDIYYCGPQLAIGTGVGRPGYHDDILIDLDEYWRDNLSAIALGDQGWSLVELIPTDARLPRVKARLPLDQMPLGYNDKIGQLRLIRH